MDPIKELNSLRNKLANYKMSVLVGSGFSKNVSSKFLTWDELLFDMCFELYGKEIEESYRMQVRSNAKRREKKSAFVSRKIKQTIRSIGYLQLVSQYIQNKGFSEAIASYIEDCTPLIERSDSKVFLSTKEGKTGLSSDALSLHKSLMLLPWNNIYTTNYDNLLEESVDIHLHSRLKQQKRDLENAIAALKEENFQSEKDENDEKEESQTKVLIKEKEKQLRYTESELSQCFTVVKDARHLQVKRTKNIIKLHGSLRTEEEKKKHKFEFDGDGRTQYIISQEHYDSYPQKHEAFTQLMRISLLQESFCLIGFSGVDPNFLSWIGWVRDLLFKHVATEDKRDYKIYLIDVSSEVLTEDKALFYENHSIVRIPLLSEPVLQFLKGQTAIDLHDSPSIQAALKLLIHYLSDHDDIVSLVPIGERINREILRNIWNSLRLADPNKKIEPSLIRTTMARLSRAKSLAIPDIHYAHTHNQNTLLQFCDTYFPTLINPEDKQSFLQLILHALKSYLLPIRSTFSNQMIKTLIENEETRKETEELIRINDALEVTLSDKAMENIDYGTILHLAFSFQFKKLENALQNWQPRKYTDHLKAGLLSLFNPGEATKILDNQVWNEEGMLEEQRLYSMELLSFVLQSLRLRSDKRLDKFIRAYQNSGYESITVFFEILEKQFLPKAKNPKPYGEGRFTISNTIHFGGNKKEAALQYLMLLIHSGFQLQLGYVTFQPHQIWYHVFKKGFELYPYPFIFFSLQYGNKDFLRRAGQDVAYADILEKELPTICEKLIESYKEAPISLKDSILCFVSQLFIAVEPQKWQNEFLAIWKKLVESKTAFSDREFEVHEFILQGLRYVNSLDILWEIIRDLLCQSEKSSGQSVLYLHALTHNRYFNSLSSENRPAAVVMSIKDLLGQIPSKPNPCLFILAYIRHFLTEEEIQMINEQLMGVDLNKIGDQRLWQVFLYFVNDNETLLTRIRNAITGHEQLWHTGIRVTEVSRGSNSFIFLDELSKKSNGEKGIFWTVDELTKIYHRLVTSFNDISRILNKDRYYISFLNELEEMVLFLSSHEAILQKIEGYEKIAKEVSALYELQRGYSSYEEGVSSRDKSQLVWALAELSRSLQKGENREACIIILLGRVLQQDPIGLEAILTYLTRWMKDPLHKESFKKYVLLLIQILRKFQLNTVEEVDIPYTAEKLIRIAHNLLSWNVRDVSIDWWINYAKKSRFNNIKQYLLKKVALAFK